MKTLLFAISTIILLLFTSCEDEMDRDITSGGGKENSLTYSTMKRDAEINYPDSLLYKQNKEYGLAFE